MNEPIVNDSPYILTKLLLSKCHNVFFQFVLGAFTFIKTNQAKGFNGIIKVIFFLLQRLFSRSTSCNRKKTFFFVFFLCAHSAIYVRTVLLFMWVQCYLFAHSAIWVRTVLFVRVNGYLLEYSASVCVRCNLYV